MDNLNVVLDILEIIIIVIGGFFLKSYLPSYFADKGKNLATKEDIEEITDKIERVRSQYSADIELLKSDLAKQSHVHQVRFEHEFKILVDIWDALIHLRKMTSLLRPIFDTHEPEKTEEQRKTERLTIFVSAYHGLVDKVEKNRPFYPIRIYEGLVSLIRIVEEEAIDYEGRSPNSHKDGYDPEYWQKTLKNSERIIATVDSLCETIRRRITA